MGLESWWGVGRGRKGDDSVHASLRGGGDTIPSEVARRGLGVGRGRSSPLPPPPAAPPSTLPPLHLPSRPGSPAAEERTRAPHPRALPRPSARSHPRSLLIHFKVHSQNSQTFSAQRGVSLGEEARTSCFSLLPRKDEGRVPAQSLRQHQFHARTRRMCGEGVGEGVLKDCRMFSSTHDICLLDASSTSPV